MVNAFQQESNGGVMIFDVFLYKLSCIFSGAKIPIQLQIVSTFILFLTFLAIWWYAWETNRLKKATATQTDLMLRPCVIIGVEPLSMILKNIGESAALNIEIETVESNLYYLQFNSYVPLKSGDFIQFFKQDLHILFKNRDAKSVATITEKIKLDLPFLRRETAEKISSYLLKIRYSNLRKQNFLSIIKVDCINRRYIFKETKALKKRQIIKKELDRKITNLINAYDEDKKKLENIKTILEKIKDIKPPINENIENKVREFAKNIEEEAITICYSEFMDIKNSLIDYSAKRNELFRGIADRQFLNLFQKVVKPPYTEPQYLEEKINRIINSTSIPVANF
ncbi:MAG: hypothetical protein JXB26_03005 [Candidatus Aminicenantes bacterium]|nr:hypothetical protein [Candidatus Aminicenantes bacterium]